MGGFAENEVAFQLGGQGQQGQRVREGGTGLENGTWSQQRTWNASRGEQGLRQKQVQLGWEESFYI